VPNVKKLKDKILCVAHESAYSIHPGGNKMYQDIKATNWWYDEEALKLIEDSTMMARHIMDMLGVDMSLG
jgi:hypothetical protein